MNRNSNHCCIAFNPFTQSKRAYEFLVPYYYGTNLSHIPFHRKLLNVLLMPFCVTQRKPLMDLIREGLCHLDLGISFYRGRWIITNGLYITPYTVEDVLRDIRYISKISPFSIRDRNITITLRLDYSYCPKRNIRVLFDNYEEKLTKDGAVISKVEYKWKDSYLERVKRWFGY